MWGSSLSRAQPDRATASVTVAKSRLTRSAFGPRSDTPSMLPRCLIPDAYRSGRVYPYVHSEHRLMSLQSIGMNIL